MGIFGKKKETGDISIRFLYYAGELQGFAQDDGVNLTATDDALIVENVTRGKSVRVTLDKSRVLGVDIFTREEEYMLKYHGQQTSWKPTKVSSALGLQDLEKRNFVVIRYESKDGIAKRLDFYQLAIMPPKIWKFKEKLEGSSVEDYSI